MTCVHTRLQSSLQCWWQFWIMYCPFISWSICSYWSWKDELFWHKLSITFCQLGLQATLSSLSPCHPSNTVAFVKDYQKMVHTSHQLNRFQQTLSDALISLCSPYKWIRGSSNPELLHTHPPTELEKDSCLYAVHCVIWTVGYFLLVSRGWFESKWDICIAHITTLTFYIFFIPFFFLKDCIFFKWCISWPTGPTQ